MNAIMLKLSAIRFAMILILFGFTTINAQESFKLSDYKNPDYQYRLLELDFNLSGRSQAASSSQYNIKSEDQFSFFGGNIQPSYFVKKNSAKYQGSQSASLNLNGYLSQTQSLYGEGPISETESKNKNRQVSINLISSNRFYNKDKLFFETGIWMTYTYFRASSDFKREPIEYPNNIRVGNNQNQFRVQVPLLIGKGRIEEVQDARLAMFILEDLQKSGNLSHSPTNAEVLAVASHITRIKNERHFDARLRKISELSSMDSLFVAMDIKQGKEISYFTLLNDNWDHAFGPIRESGSRLTVGIVPMFNRYFSNNFSKYADTTNNNHTEFTFLNKSLIRQLEVGAEIMASFAFEKPVGLVWQHSSYFKAGYSINQKNQLWETYESDILIDGLTTDWILPDINLLASHAIGYYPNTRTEIYSKATLRYSLRAIKEQIENTPDFGDLEEIASVFAASLRIGGTYYFSPQLTFNAYIVGIYQNDNKTVERENDPVKHELSNRMFDANLMAGFTYKIF